MVVAVKESDPAEKLEDAASYQFGVQYALQRSDAVMFHFDDIDRNDVFTGRVLYQFAGSMYILGIWRISDPWNLSGSRADSEIKDVVYEEENTGRIYYGWNIRRH